MTIDKTNTVIKHFNDFISSLKDESLYESSFVSYISVTDEINFYSTLNVLSKNPQTLFYYSIPEQNFYIAASGILFSKSFDNADDLNKYSSQFKEFETRIVHNYESNNYYPPLFFLAAKFPSKKFSIEWNNFDPVNLFIPELIIIRTDEKYFSVVNIRTDSGKDRKILSDEFKLLIESFKEITAAHIPDLSKPDIKLFRAEKIGDWCDKVDHLLSGIKNKEFEKVVLSRSIEFKISKNTEPSKLALLLDQKYPECFNFIYKVKDTIFFSASPEKLFRIRNGKIFTEALAGSIERGNTKWEDNSLASSLIKSPKDNDEHVLVIEHLRNLLNKYCRNVTSDDSPSLKRLSNIQHLHTTLSGSLTNEADLFSIIKDIFPTPAVGGYPVLPAINVIDEIEDFDRGLFTGFIGWMNLINECDFIVAIRSGLIRNEKLYVYAGCGIVHGSDPKKEFEETQLKSEAIISLFNNENKS